MKLPTKADILAALDVAWNAVRRNLKPLWKRALKEAVQRGGDKLQEELDAMIEREAEKALPKIHARIDGLQARFAELVRAVPCLPKAVEDEAIGEVNRAVDSLQARLNAVAVAGGAAAGQAALDAAFDRFQDELKSRIDAL